MLIAVLSDTHSRYKTVSHVLDVLTQRGVSLILHCGDIEDEETVELFRGHDTHFVFGNCDHDRAGLRHAMKKNGATLHEQFGSLDLQGSKIAWSHGDDARLLGDIENSGHYDFLFYGHTHRPSVHQTGPTKVINPGALYRAKTKSFLILDLTSKDWETVAVEL